MARRLSKRKMPDREKKQMKVRQKLESAVFDINTMKQLSNFISKGVIDSLDYPIATGKEADVFRATAGNGYAAVKIYRIETSNFLKMQDYMKGDQRFSHIKRNKMDIVFAWTKKEFRNLVLFNQAGVESPTPIAFKRNIMIMEFIGEGGLPDSTLKEIGTETPDETFECIISYMRSIHARGLVHADLSEYNILMHRGMPCIIDVGQAVLLNHPKAEEFLGRDIKNISKYFRRYGVKADEKELLKEITAPA
ncbi:MAG: serine protein kinase RIO [Candidatus Micrarchaeota archaeon]